MRRRVITVLASTLVLVALTAMPVGAGPPDTATMQFGRPDLGTGCNPGLGCTDDASFHAVDRIVPGAVAISAGGEVTFNVDGFHQVTIYEAGTKPKDINPDTGLFPFINDPSGMMLEPRVLWQGPVGAGTDFTFDDPGKYLVICNIAPHFELAQMWGWVNVK